LTGKHIGHLRAWWYAAVCALMLLVPRIAAAQETQVTRIGLPVGRSYPFRSEDPIQRVSIVNDAVAEVVVISERELVVNGRSSGETDVILWLASGRRLHWRIQVVTAPDRAQVSLSVKVAEVRRDALRELGVSGIYRDNRDVRVGTGLFRSDAPFDEETGNIILPPATRFLTVLSDFGTDDFLAFLEAEEQKGNARLLAEPNLLVANRDSASFLAGGELPIPVVQSGGGGAGGSNVTIQYREFGVRLNFTPEILSDSLIRLRVTPEVSSLDFANAVLLQGFRIPALRTRRISSNVDVKRNESLVISGMLNSEQERVTTGVPFLKDIPILGLLFSSTRWQRNETELLVIVTPTIVDPMRPRTQDQIRLRPDTTRPAREAIQPRVRP
jgi:pilus assembly protein CpaC